MQAIEMKVVISNDGKLQIPLTCQQYYGKQTKVIVLFPDVSPASETKTIVDLMPFANTLAWQVDGMAYQQQIRQEWDKN